MKKVKVEVLYFEGCPNHKAAVRLVQEVARELQVTVDIEEVQVRNIQDAARLHFLGSPTIRVDGADVEPGARGSTTYAFACRTYGTGGLPSRELVAAALRAGEAEQTKGLATEPTKQGMAEERSGRWVGAAAVSAVLASACCLGPLVLTAVGLSTLGVSAAFEQARPLFLVVTAVLLAGAFYSTYFRKPTCASDSACALPGPKRSRWPRAMLWLATVAVALVALFPVYGGRLLRTTTSPGAASAGETDTVTLQVEGMTCNACAVNIEKSLRKVPGVLSVSVSYAEKRAAVITDAKSPPSDKALISAVADAGYRAGVQTREP